MNRVLPLQTVIDRIKATPNSFREIGGAGDFSRMLETFANWPGAWVLPASDRPGPNRYAGCKVGHRVATQFVVMIVARDVTGRTGTDGLSELDIARGEVHDAILNWDPTDAFEACIYLGGELVSDVGDDGLLFWQATYETAFQLESA